MNTGLREILTTRIWNMRPSVLHNYRVAIENNINASIPVEVDDNPDSFFCCKSQGYQNTLIAGDAEIIDEYCALEPDDEIVNVIVVNGPITRNGDGCSIGSKQQRDKIMHAARMPQCVGHLIMIDTPGGSAFSKNDYAQAIDAAHEAGQPVVAFIDGMCCSAGMALASLCDEIYYMHGNDEVGCIGTMAAFYSNKDGDVNTIDQSTYHELYDPESFEKNLEFRNCAEGDSALILEDLAKDGEEFRGMVQAHRPNVTDEHLHGKVFKAGEVEGILVDGRNDFDGCIARILELASAPAEEPQEEPADPEPPMDEPQPNDEPAPQGPEPDDPDRKPHSEKPRKLKPGMLSDDDSDSDNDETNNNPVALGSAEGAITTKQMQQYTHINTALGIEALAVTEDGSFYCNGALAETLESRLAEAEQNEALLAANTETVTTLNAKVAELKAEAENTAAAHAEEVNGLNEQIEALKAENEALNTKVTEISEQKANSEDSLTGMEEEKKNLEAQLAEANEAKAALEQQLADKQAEIDELAKQSAPAATPAPSAPAAEEQKPDTRAMVQKIYSPTMTADEKAAAREARMAYLKSIK